MAPSPSDDLPELEAPLWEQLAARSKQLPGGERLQKVLASTGWGSRRSCEELIAEGRVTVNGELALLGRRVDPQNDLIEVDGAPVGVKPGLVYYLLNKPTGVVTTAKDTHGRKTVVDLVPSEPRVFPVGRLDVETEGLLLMTNDGDLAHRITHPSHGVEKEYLVHVKGRLTPGELRRLREGVELEDGMTAPADASRSTRAATVRCAECVMRSITPSCGWFGHALDRSPIGRCAQGTIANSRRVSDEHLPKRSPHRYAVTISRRE